MLIDKKCGFRNFENIYNNWNKTYVRAIDRLGDKCIIVVDKQRSSDGSLVNFSEVKTWINSEVDFPIFSDSVL